MEGEIQRPASRGSVRRTFVFLWLLIQYIFDSLIDAVIANARIIWRESDLFLGSALSSIGIFGFDVGKFCDGNTADYLSCTRPSAYYYFDALDIALIVIGISFILLWFMKRRHNS